MLEDNIDSLKQKSSIEMLRFNPEYKNRKKVYFSFVYFFLKFMHKFETVLRKANIPFSRF